MENIETTQAAPEPVIENLHLSVPSQPLNNLNFIHPSDAGERSCPTCSASKNTVPVQYIYTLGKIQPRFPSIGIEKEFAQAVGRIKTDGMTDNAVMFKILSESQNRYLTRKLCWTLSIEGLETYLMQPMNTADLEMLINTLNPKPKLQDINVVIGILGSIAPVHYCNGLQIPIVGFDQIYSFDVDTLIKAIPNPGKVKEFAPIAEELFMKILQMTDNAGATDDHRALNYLSVRYHAIYATAADCYSRNFSLTGVEVRPSALNGTRKMVDVIFTYSNRTSDATEKYYCRVDVTEEFPFLVTKMQTYVDR